ncbi:MAG: hypothetical protein WB802_09225 [Candidatus Dormiibacterota bacterium]
MATRTACFEASPTRAFGTWLEPARTDGNPCAEVLNRTQKHVASRTLQEPLLR